MCMFAFKIYDHEVKMSLLTWAAAPTTPQKWNIKVDY